MPHEHCTWDVGTCAVIEIIVILSRLPISGMVYPIITSGGGGGGGGGPPTPNQSKNYFKISSAGPAQPIGQVGHLPYHFFP